MQSVTLWGIVLAVAVPLLVQLGFSDGCANEIMTIVPTLPGLAVAWYGRVRVGDITVLGARHTRPTPLNG